MRARWNTLLLVLLSASQVLGSTYQLTVHRLLGAAAGICTDARIRETQPHRLLRASSTSTTPASISKSRTFPAHDGRGKIEQIRVFAHSEEFLHDKLADLCPNLTSSNASGDRTQGQLGPHPQSYAQISFSDTLGRTPVFTAQDDSDPPAEVPPLELMPIAGSGTGSSANRVDITFFSDGYLASERDKFVRDVVDLVREISGNQTFHTVAPLLNFWAAFTPSNESGVGVGGVPKDTPFGLYRDGTELRALYYAKPEVARAACDFLGDRCDYPVLIGNDPLYGGLGGEFVTITPSKMNGALVLRHELGHSVIEVGEEYDGGFAYFGANAGHDSSAPMPWAHWLTHTPPSTLPRVERSVMPLQTYPWTLLNASAPWTTKFNSSGTYARHLVRFSLSGLPTTTDLTVLLDGDDLGWSAKEGLGVDRWHYDVYRDVGLVEGEHEVTFVLNEAAREGGAQLCSVEILEFGGADEFDAAPGVYGVFPTFSESNKTSYRPTNEDCLMRIVDKANFCRACVEGLWHALLARVDLIDGLRAECVPAPDSNARLRRALNASLVRLAGLREEEEEEVHEAYAIAWTRDGIAVEEFANATYVVLEEGLDVGTFEVAVEFVTEEVRVDADGLLKSRRSIDVASEC